MPLPLSVSCLSVFCSEDKAKAASRELGINIERGVAKPRKSKSCKKIGEGAEERCEVRRKKASPKKKAKAAPKKVTRRRREVLQEGL